MVFIHAGGIVATTRLLGLQDRNLRAQPIDFRAFGLLVSIGLCLFVLIAGLILIVGGGIAGASLAAAVAPRLRTMLVEAEAQPGYHSTGRSAAGPLPVVQSIPWTRG